MGDLALGKSFNMLVDERWHYAVTWMHGFLSLLGPATPVPWLARLGFGLPGATREWHRFVKWCQVRMGERIEVSDIQ